MRGATAHVFFDEFLTRNFNPHSPCGERLRTLDDIFITAVISIHTPHAGSDIFTFKISKSGWISIHTPHAGSDTANTFVCRS